MSFFCCLKTHVKEDDFMINKFVKWLKENPLATEQEALEAWKIMERASNNYGAEAVTFQMEGLFLYRAMKAFGQDGFCDRLVS